MKKFKLLFLLLIPFSLCAQEKLTLSSAMEIALKNNFDIGISRNDAQLSKNNNTLGNAGFLPRADVALSYSTALNNTSQRYSDGRVVNRDGASTEALAAGGQINWTLFNGLKMFAAKSRLEASEFASGMALKLQIENSVAGIIRAYFNAVKTKQQIKVLEETITIYDERIKIAEARFNVGSASGLDRLQARVDRNERTSQLLRQKILLDAALSELNRLMGKNEFVEYELQDSIVINSAIIPTDYRQSVLKNNNEIKLGEATLGIDKYFIREVQSLQYPVLDLNFNYNYSRSENEVGFLLLNQNQGPSAGLTLSWNLFNGFNTRREIKNAKLNFRSTELLLSQTRSKIEHSLYIAIKQYNSDLEILKLEESNWDFARENAVVSLEAYRLGSISGIQLKEAQNSYEESFARLVEARYQAKLSETELMRLNGDLVK